jgi:tetratricopeptide (TPR) repeat protein
MKCSLRSLALVATSSSVSLALLVSVGCAAGHGQYTSEGKNLAQERMASIKSGADWDMARQQFLAGDLKKALKSVNNSISTSDAVAKSHSLRGRILVELGQLEGAMDEFKRTLALNPAYVEAIYYQGVIHERYAEVDKALERYQAAAALEPADPQFAIATAEMMIELGRIDDAKRMLEGRNSHFEHNAGVRQTLGHMAMMQDDADKAIEYFQSANMLDPDNLANREDLAIAYVSAADYVQAEYTIKQLLRDEQYQNRTDIKQLRARCLVALDRPVEAREILLGLTRDDADINDVGVWVDLGEVALKLGDYNRVRIAAGRIVALDESRFEGPLLGAMWKRHKGDLQAALKSAQRAVSLARASSATPSLIAAMLLLELGQTDDAQAALFKAMSIEPDNKRVANLLAVVESDR